MPYALMPYTLMPYALMLYALMPYALVALMLWCFDALTKASKHQSIMLTKGFMVKAFDLHRCLSKGAFTGVGYI